MKMFKNFLKIISKETFHIYLKKDNLDRLEKFCNSMNIVKKSSHWTERNNKDILKFDKNKVIFKRPPTGFDRNYKFKFSNQSPIEKYDFAITSIKKKISNLAKNFTGIGFDEILHFKKFWEKNKSYFNSENIISKNKFGKKTFLYNCSNTDPFWYFNEIYDYCKNNILDNDLNSRKINCIEIGPGNGDFISVLKKNLNIDKFYIIDISETIPFSFLNIVSNFPNSKYLLPNEINEKNLADDNIEFIFLDNTQIQFIKKNFFDLAINTMSFGEMDHETINKYFEILRNSLKEKNLFLNINRYEKLVELNDEKLLIKMSDYPYAQSDYHYKNEICKFNIGKNLNNAFIRITKLKKKEI